MGLIKTGMKAAVAVKVGHMVHDRIQQRQHAEWAASGHPAPMSAAGGYAQTMPASPPGAVPQQAVPPAAAPGTSAPGTSALASDMLDQLAQLGELKASGVLADDEFQRQKTRILNG